MAGGVAGVGTQLLGGAVATGQARRGAGAMTGPRHSERGYTVWYVEWSGVEWNVCVDGFSFRSERKRRRIMRERRGVGNSPGDLDQGAICFGFQRYVVALDHSLWHCMTLRAKE